MSSQRVIWHQPELQVEQVQKYNKINMAKALDIVVTALGPDWVEGTMPVDERTMQPAGLLHGGASVVLAETLGSVAGNMALDFSKEMAVGQSINASHIRAVTEGIVIGRAQAAHIGRRSQVWEIRIETPDKKLVCLSRLTLAVVPRAK